MRLTHGIKVGDADVDPSAASHIEGVPQGNAPGGFERNPGFYHDKSKKVPGHPDLHKGLGQADARRSTGVNSGARNPIVPGAPNLTPA